jgi:hypothetical protein
VADVDGDGRQDFCLSTDGGHLYAINAGGAILPGFPKSMSAPSICGVAAGDIDGDGLLELVSATWNGWVYAWDTNGPALPGRADWPMRGVDARNTGIYHRVDPAAVASSPRFAPRLEIAPDPAPGRAEFRLSGARDGTRIDLLDVLGRRVDTVTLSSGRALWVAGPDLPAGVYLARWQSRGSILGSRLVLLR